jgi:hypothetical protein
MKNKKYLFFGTLIMGMAFASVLAGCPTTGSATSPTPETEQLAADLNAIKAGSVTVEGATVRISGEVYLTTSLTVPAGVTLDLTADGAKFELQDGAKLTVDGTVNAGGHGNGVAGGLRIGDGAAVINGSGTIRLRSKGRLLSISGVNRYLTLDGVTLVGIADNDNSLVTVGGGGDLVMKSGAISGNTANNNRAGVLVNGEGTTFTMSGGIISGNNVSGKDAKGGGVAAGDIFTMQGGTIYGSDAGDNANEIRDSNGTPVTGRGAAISVERGVPVKYGTGGTYTKGGAAQTGGSDIGNSDDTLVAVPAR